MNEENNNATTEEVVTPQTELSPETTGAENISAENEEVAVPQTDINAMSDDEFIDYLTKVRDNNLSVQSEDAPQNNGARGGNAELSANVANEEVASSRNNDDTDNHEVQQQSENTKPFKVFASQEDWQKTIDGIVGERLKSSRQAKEQLDSILQQAAEFYDTKDTAELVNKLVEDFRMQNADKHGVDVDVYRQQQQDALDAQRYRQQQQAEQQKEQRLQEIQMQWTRESEELKKIVPDFDFNTAMQNPQFYDAVIRGQSIGIAYMMTNQQKTPPAPPKQERRPIKQNGGMSGTSGGAVEFNPETASDADFEKYINKIRNRN